MALEYVDSCDDPDMLAFKWNTQVGVAAIESGLGRTGSCLSVSTLDTNGYSSQLTRRLSADSTTLIISAAVKIPSGMTSDAVLMFAWDNQNSGCLRLVYSTGGYLYWQRFSGGIADYAVNGSSVGPTVPISTNTWHYLEWKVTHGDATTGRMILRKNETTAADVTIDTRSWYYTDSSVSYRYYGIGGMNYAGGNTYTYRRAVPVRWDDVVVQRGSDSVFFGDVNVERVQPSADGTYHQLLGVDRDSTDNYVWVKRPTPPASTTFDPTSITGLAAWYSADKVDGTNPTVLGPVSQWTDRSGSGRHLTGVGPAAYPTAEGVGNLTGIHFDGSSDLLKYSNATPFFTTSDLTVFVVAQKHNLGNEYSRVISLAGTGLDDYSNSSGFNIDTLANGNVQLERNNSYSAFAGTRGRSARHIYCAVWSAAGGVLYINGTQFATNVAGVPFSVNSITVGGDRDGSASMYLGGYYFEVLIYNAALTPTQRTDVETYLAARWKTTPELSFGSYVTGDNSGSKRDSYVTPGPAANQGTPLGAQANILASSSDSAANKQFIPEVVISGSVYAGLQSPASYAGGHLTLPLQINPATGLPWTFAELNALEVGVRVV